MAAAGADGRGSARSKLRDHLSPRRERALFAALGFAVALGIARATTAILHAKGEGQDGGIVVGDIHVHHYLFGLAAVFLVAFLWMLEIGISAEGSVWGSRLLSATFGVGAALVLDEFALLLNLRDVYWQEAGRSSLEVAAGFGGLLLVAAAVRPFGRARWQERRDRRRG
jgi:hypothetical protein